MRAIVLGNRKLVVLYSPKCGCSSIKRILMEAFGITPPSNHDELHKVFNSRWSKGESVNPETVMDYTIIVVIRNPYTRLISGVANKYTPKSELYHKVPSITMNFQKFVEDLIEGNGWIDRHHFLPQVSGPGGKLLQSLEARGKIPDHIFQVHEMNQFKRFICQHFKSYSRDRDEEKVNSSKSFDIHSNTRLNVTKYSGYVKGANIIQFKNLKRYDFPDPKSFYTVKLKNQVRKHYQDDFEYFERWGFDFDI